MFKEKSKALFATIILNGFNLFFVFRFFISYQVFYKSADSISAVQKEFENSGLEYSADQIDSILNTVNIVLWVWLIFVVLVFITSIVAFNIHKKAYNYILLVMSILSFIVFLPGFIMGLIAFYHNGKIIKSLDNKITSDDSTFEDTISQTVLEEQIEDVTKDEEAPKSDQDTNNDDTKGE